MKLINICGHTFIKDILGSTPLVVDCGANYGIFSTHLAKEHSATIYGFEPDPRLFPILPKLENVFFFNTAISGSGEKLVLNLGNQKCSSAYFSEDSNQATAVVNSTKLSIFCKENGLNKIDLLKLDIEGAEIDVLEKLSSDFLAAVGQITVEFHDFLDSSETPKIQKVVRKIQNAGFYFLKFSHNDYSDCLFINTRLHPIDSFSKIYFFYTKYNRGIKRILQRYSKQRI